MISYIALILLVNVGFSYLPAVQLGSNAFSSADFLVGFIYLARDFAQRQVGHWVMLAMLVGTLLSFWLADPQIANASAAAFAIGEIIDWLVFTWTGKPLSQRLLLSASLSAPIDTVVFLYLIHHLTGLEFGIMTLMKCLGVLVLWKYWYIQRKRAARVESAVNFG